MPEKGINELAGEGRVFDTTLICSGAGLSSPPGWKLFQSVFFQEFIG